MIERGGKRDEDRGEGKSVQRRIRLTFRKGKNTLGGEKAVARIVMKSPGSKKLLEIGETLQKVKQGGESRRICGKRGAEKGRMGVINEKKRNNKGEATLS